MGHKYSSNSIAPREDEGSSSLSFRTLRALFGPLWRTERVVEVAQLSFQACAFCFSLHNIYRCNGKQLTTGDSTASANLPSRDNYCNQGGFSVLGARPSPPSRTPSPRINSCKSGPRALCTTSAILGYGSYGIPEYTLRVQIYLGQSPSPLLRSCCSSTTLVCPPRSPGLPYSRNCRRRCYFDSSHSPRSKSAKAVHARGPILLPNITTACIVYHFAFNSIKERSE